LLCFLRNFSDSRRLCAHVRGGGGVRDGELAVAHDGGAPGPAGYRGVVETIMSVRPRSRHRFPAAS
jgi:hypothetical protein